MIKQGYTGKLGARDYKVNQRELYIRRFTLRQTETCFYILFDDKPFISVRRDMPMPATFAFKIAYTALFYCLGKRTQVWDELAAMPYKDIELMQSIAYGLNSKFKKGTGQGRKKRQLELDGVLHADGG